MTPSDGGGSEALRAGPPSPRAPGLSARLETVLAALAPAGGPEALWVDVGTDHGQLMLAALARGLTPRALGIDRAAAPLAGARANAQRAGLAESLSLRLGDGLAPLEPGEAPTAIALCGMGGATIARVLEAGAAHLGAVRRIIAQPNTEPELVRDWAQAHGWHLLDEPMLHEQGRVVWVLVFAPGAGPDPSAVHPDFTPAELRVLGPRLVRSGSEAARRFYRAQHDRLARLGRPEASLYARALAAASLVP